MLGYKPVKLSREILGVSLWGSAVILGIQSVQFDSWNHRMV